MKRKSEKGNILPMDPSTISSVNLRGRPQNAGMKWITCFNQVKNSAKTFFEQQELNRFVASIKYENLPVKQPFWLISTILYKHGSVVAFNYKGNAFILPFAISGELDIYAMPRFIKPIAFNNSLNLELNRPLELGKECCIWYDMTSFTNTTNNPSRSQYINSLIEIKAEIIKRINMSIMTHFDKTIVKVADIAQADNIAIAMQAQIENGSPVGVVSGDINTEINGLKSNHFVANELFQTLKNIDSLINEFNGEQNSGVGNDKNERLVTGELDGIAERTAQVRELRQRLADIFTMECKNVLGWNEFNIRIGE